MAGLWQRTGNVTVTNGSKTVTGFGTKWKTGTLPIQKGHTFYGPDNAACEVDTVVSDTEILLVEVYRGGTLANQAYRIDITRTSTISQFAADLASLVGKYRSWFDGMMVWLTGSGDVPILNPDTGTTTTIPSWKKVASEGEGQAARSKVEADRAVKEADRAKANADLAGNIVAAAALPLPDVWAPLSDSLRLITGYGRDVTVGEDVVARMVNFSRSTTATYLAKDGTLKTAAINEPRFENEGLLIEGQSTNLISTQSFSSTSTVTVTPNQPSPDGANNAQKIESISNPTLIKNAIAPAATLTASWFFKMDGNGSLDVLMRNSTTSTNLLSTTITVTNGVATVATPSLSKLIPIKDGWYRHSFTQGTGIAAGDTISVYFGLVGATTPGRTFTLFGLQAEGIPFASSYIPTNGVVVTRSSDFAVMPRLPNMGCLLPADLTVAIEFNKIGFDSTYGNYVVSLVDIDNADRYGITTSSDAFDVYGFDGYGNSFSASINRTNKRPLVLMLGKDASRGYGVNGTFSPAPGGNAKARVVPVGDIQLGRRVSGSASWGHFRNFRIWRRALTGEQIKAIA